MNIQNTIKQIFLNICMFLKIDLFEEYELKIKELEDKLKDLDEDVILEAKSLGNIQFFEMLDILSKHCNDVHISDSQFDLTSMEEGKKFAALTKVDIKNYIAEGHDCDNFSFALMGYWSMGLISFPFGIAWSAKHAFNFMIDYKKQLWIIEPQTNKWFKIEDVMNNTMYYPIRMILC